MTIDERLDRLTQGHEALTQSVELLTADLHEMKDQLRDTKEHLQRTTEHLERTVVNDIADGTARLLHLAQIHEQRISRL